MQSAKGKKYAERYHFGNAITGCDTVSAFNGRGKKAAWDVWDVFEKVTRSFIKETIFFLLKMHKYCNQPFHNNSFDIP